jgi:hypothetical protein
VKDEPAGAPTEARQDGLWSSNPAKLNVSSWVDGAAA